MKRIIKSIVILLSVSLLVGCAVGASADTGKKGRNSENEGNAYKIKAVVNKVSEERIEATVTEDSEDAFGLYHILLSEKTTFFDSDNQSITLADIKENDIIEVEYNGQVMRSYPPQIVALKITKSK